MSFSESLARVAKVYESTKCISQENKPYLARPTLIDLNPNELHFYFFLVSLVKCSGICITLDNLSSRIWFLNKIDDVNLDVFNMITRIK